VVLIKTGSSPRESPALTDFVVAKNYDQSVICQCGWVQLKPNPNILWRRRLSVVWSYRVADRVLPFQNFSKALSGHGWQAVWIKSKHTKITSGQPKNLDAGFSNIDMDKWLAHANNNWNNRGKTAMLIAVGINRWLGLIAVAATVRETALSR